MAADSVLPFGSVLVRFTRCCTLHQKAITVVGFATCLLHKGFEGSRPRVSYHFCYYRTLSYQGPGYAEGTCCLTNGLIIDFFSLSLSPSLFSGHILPTKKHQKHLATLINQSTTQRRRSVSAFAVKNEVGAGSGKQCCSELGFLFFLLAETRSVDFSSV